MKKVTILLSTYNGEKYLNEQLESILGQVGVIVTLIVRDDGSTDNTISILEKYSKDAKLTILKGANLGVANSFMDLLYNSPESEYYAFADQDDIWLPNKLNKAIEILEAKDTNTPLLYASNQMLVDSKLNELGVRHQKTPDISLIGTLCNNRLSGCTMVLNKTLRDYIIKKNHKPSSDFLKVRIHDVWVALVAALLGEIIFDENSYILYRQHENNVVGAFNKNPYERVKIIFNKLMNVEMRNARSKTAKELLKRFEGELNQENQYELAQIAFYRKSIKTKFKMAIDKEIKLYRDERNYVVYFLKVMLGWI